MKTEGLKPITFQPIGTISTPHKVEKNTPHQSQAARNITGEIKIFPQFRGGLNDLIGFERIWLIYYMHRASFSKLSIVPHIDIVERGLFATRSPGRPNPIGLSAVQLMDLDGEEGILKILGVDMLDGTPLLDIKPYIPRLDSYPGLKAGWFDRVSRNYVDGDKKFS